MNSAATREMRAEVKKYVDKADDKMIKILYAMIEAEQDEDWWDKLPKKVQAEIDAAIEDLDSGKGVPHEEVLKKYSKWFTR